MMNITCNTCQHCHVNVVWTKSGFRHFFGNHFIQNQFTMISWKILTTQQIFTYPAAKTRNLRVKELKQ